VSPHWGFADDRLGSAWASRLDGGVVVVRLGRQSDDGRFELDLQIQAEQAAAAVDLTRVTVDLGGEVIGARLAPGMPARLEAAARHVAVARVYFEPARRDWVVKARGTLGVPLEIGGGPQPLQVPLDFRERLVSWAEARRRFGYLP
jgi:hypothetical protein